MVPVFAAVCAALGCGRMGSKLNPLVNVKLTWLPAPRVAEVSPLPAVSAMVDVVAGAVKAGFGAVTPLVQPLQLAPSERLICGKELTVALSRVAGLSTVTPAGRNEVSGMFIRPLSGIGTSHVISQFGAEVGTSQAAAMIASAMIPTGRRRIFISIFFEGPRVFSRREEGLSRYWKDALCSNASNHLISGSIRDRFPACRSRRFVLSAPRKT